jgi:hypothetical protein
MQGSQVAPLTVFIISLDRAKGPPIPSREREEQQAQLYRNSSKMAVSQSVNTIEQLHRTLPRSICVFRAARFVHGGTVLGSVCIHEPLRAGSVPVNR